MTSLFTDPPSTVIDPDALLTVYPATDLTEYEYDPLGSVNVMVADGDVS
jgi:hypothetical protein